MNTQFKVGDKVRIINDGHFMLPEGHEFLVTKVQGSVVYDGAAAVHKGRLETVPTHRVTATEVKEAMGFTGQFSAAKVDESKKESAFLSARSKAWDKYAESRRLLNKPSGSARQEGFSEGYTQGFTAGKQAERTMIGVTVCEGRARCTDPATSQQAAKVVQAGKLADLVLVSLRDAGPGTAHEVAERIGHPLNAVSPRFVTLKRRGLIHVSGGQKAGRSTRSIYSYGGAPL